MRPPVTGRRSTLVAYGLSISLGAWETYQIVFNPLFPLPLRVAFGTLAGFLLVTFFFVWRYFPSTSKPQPA